MSHHTQFEAHRTLLFSIAYRMLGTAMEAEDIIQDAYLSYSKSDFESIQSHKYYLTTIVTRLCINRMNSAQAQREMYTNNWLPEPIATHDNPLLLNPSERLSKYDSISMAFLIILEKLSPPERAVFLLREVFDYDYAEIARIVEKSEESCRQLFSRAKKHIRSNRPRFDSDPQKHEAILTRFLQVVEGGDLNNLVSMLAEDAVLIIDGGTRRGRATRPVHSASKVAQFILGINRLSADLNLAYEMKVINGQLGFVSRLRDTNDAYFVITFAFAQGKIKQIHVVGDDKKLKRV